MSDKPKILVFLGAPPPPLEPVSEVEVRAVSESRPWKTMNFLWQGGRLRPTEGEDGTRVGTAPCRDTSLIPEPGQMAHTSKDHSRLEDGHHIQIRSQPEEEQACQNKNPDSHQESSPSQTDQADVEREDLCSESVKDYLDSCFQAGQPDPEPEPYPDRSETPSDPIAASVSLDTEYLSAWTVSQALVLRSRLQPKPGPSLEQSPHPPDILPSLAAGLTTQPGPSSGKAHSQQTPPRETAIPIFLSSSSPELYSPGSSTPSPRELANQQGSMELFYEPMLSQRLEKGGVILEVTQDGMLCSQSEPVGAEPGLSRAQGSLSESPVHTSPKAPAPKRSKVSPSLSKTERSPETSTGNACVPTSLLTRCSKQGVRYCVLVAVVHPCHLKEIKLKRGMSAGTSVPLASIVVTDQSAVEMKVVLWRKAAFWALTVYPGDMLLITGVMVNEDKWRGETVLQSSYTSRLLNLGQVTTSRSPPVPQDVNAQTLRSLCSYLRVRRPLLLSVPPRIPQNPHALPHARLRSLRPNTLVHALLRVTHTEMITAWRSETEGTSRTGGVLKAVLSVEQGDGHQGAVVLWGTALTWLTRINRNKDAVWDFRVLLVRESMTSDLLELHSTPWGSCEPLFPDDCRALDFYRPGLARSTTSIEIDLRTLLSQKYTGDVELKAHITMFQFQGSPSQTAQQPLDCDTSLESILETVSGDITFTGCGRCAAELDTDANGIYCPCYPCLPHTGVRRYYRPVVLTVKEGESQVCVQVPPVPLQAILLNTPPDKLNKTVAPGSDVRYVQVIADRIHFLLALPRRTVILTVRSHFLCDENSVPTVQDFLLLDLQFP
ncbi:shieldin complex subunit 2 isoform X1 [Hypomesus transpacificus]|uniref:shieldin complex subunit 2 isoform X1 n=1 Tax=Hypomesus transpacificus TaxID=137520 RepID=UPI001F0823FE|nr:shieldin complex subunit 2 isoform X1 [Hypomesus transpacificus]